LSLIGADHNVELLQAVLASSAELPVQVGDLALDKDGTEHAGERHREHQPLSAIMTATGRRQEEFCSAPAGAQSAAPIVVELATATVVVAGMNPGRRRTSSGKAST
jgi:hypothetical protein